jgi:hypothetical protein
MNGTRLGSTTLQQATRRAHLKPNYAYRQGWVLPEKDWANDKEGFFQSLLSAAGITANGAVDAVGASQFFDALQSLKQSQSGTAFTTSGSAGVLTLAPTPAICVLGTFATPCEIQPKQHWR